MDKIILDVFNKDFLVTIKDYKKIHLDLNQGTYYTIKSGGKKVGVIGFFKMGEDGNPGLKIGIHQDFRGQGIFGKALELLVKKHKFNKIYSELAKSNIVSVKAHKKIGFKRISEKKEDLLKEKGLAYKRSMMFVKKF